MELSSGLSPRVNSGVLDKDINHDPESDLQSFELESADNGTHPDHHFQFENALDILRECVRILRYNLMGFMNIATFLICPVSAVLLSNVLVNSSMVKRLTIRLLIVAKSSGIPLNSFIKQGCPKFSEMVISAVMCFPLYVTLLLMSKAAIVHSVDCTYSTIEFDSLKFYVLMTKIWKRVMVTYLWVCIVVSGCLTLFLVFLGAVSYMFSFMGFHPEFILYPAIVLGIIFSTIFANAIVICNVAIVVSVLEDEAGLRALLRSSSLIKGQTQIGLQIFLVSTIGMAIVEGLFDHRVKTISYGDGSSRLWEGPLLVIMYSFVMLVDSMMISVFYFSCKSYKTEASTEESQPILEALAEVK